MLLTHTFTHLWKESGILDLIHSDIDGLEGYQAKFGGEFHRVVRECGKFARKQKRDCKRGGGSEKEQAEASNQTIGMMGEVLVEYFTRLYPEKVGVKEITDTCENQFTRGYDFWGLDPRDRLVLIQVKMGGLEKTFTEDKLFTFLDEANINVDSRYHHSNVVLMIPSNTEGASSALSYKHDFNKRMKRNMTVFTGKEMADVILNADNNPDQCQVMYEFWCGFQKAIDESTK